MEALGAKDYRRDCRYGADCYQKNPEHRAKFKHTAADTLDADSNSADSRKDEEAKENKRPLSIDSDTEGVTVEMKKPKTVHEMSASDDSQEETAQDQGEIEDEKPGKSIELKTDAEEVFDDILADFSDKSDAEQIKEAFLISMPRDFFQFYEFCQSLNSTSPLEAMKPVNLQLCGPYDLLAGNIPATAPRSRQLFLTHGRGYYDPPEMTTVLCEADYKTGLHIGYYRDSPTAAPVFLVSGVETAGAKLTVLGDNLFAAVYHVLNDRLDTADPFLRSKMMAMQEKVKLRVNKFVMEQNSAGLNLERKTVGMKSRDRAKVAVTFHGAGIVVPFDRKTEVGYREIPETAAGLRKILTRVVEAESESEKDRAFDALQELVTNVQFANDEGDPGMGLELGLALLCHGGLALHNTARHLLSVAYELLDREEFTSVLNAHLARRTKGSFDSFARWRK